MGVALEGMLQPIAARSIHWMALQMGELTIWDIEMSRLWVEVDNDPYMIPVSKNFLHKLLDTAEKGVRCDQVERRGEATPLR